MNRQLAIIAAAMLVTTGCGSCFGRDAAERTPSPEADAPTATPAAHRNELEIAQGMLRDLRITTAAVQQTTGADAVATILGELKVNEDAYAELAAPLPGRVTRLMAGVGDRVAAGAPLAELQSAELGRARAAVLAASGRITLARTTLARTRALAAERIAPQREVQAAEAELAASEAERAAADAALGALGARVDDAAATDDPARFTLRSPVGGVVIARDVVVGQAIGENPGALFKIADLSVLWLTVHAFERDAVRIVPGTTAQVTVSALPGRTMTGRVSHIGGQVDAQSRTVPVRILVANRDGRLRPGMSASARLPIGDATTRLVTVPAGALQRLGGAWVVFVPKDAGHFEIREVGRGRDLEGQVEIVHGLGAGERVVVDGSFVLKAEAEKARGLGGDDHP